MSAPEPLFRLIYASRMSTSVAANPDATLQSILSVAVPNNGKVGVTGLLVAHQGWFIQALEGRESEVRRLYEHISLDPRHHGAVVIASGRQPLRIFGAWTMCARTLSRTDEAMLAVLDQRSSFDPTMLPERSVIRLLETVGAVHAQVFRRQQSTTAI